jgi:hypothetical protein
MSIAEDPKMKTRYAMAIGSFCMLVGACGSEPAAPVWTETSRSIEVECFAFFQGSMRFEASRDQLSSAQVDMLSSMTVIDAAPSCVGDGMGCSLSVVQGDASTTMIGANDTDSGCGTARTVVSFATFDPFRRSLGCQYAKDLTQPNTARPVPADARCFNGLFMSTDGGNIPVVLQVDDAAAVHHIELADCAQAGRVGKLSFTVRDSDGATVFGTSSVPADPGPNATCASLDQTFPRTGTFTLDVAVEPGVLPAGDLSLRFW